MEVMTPEEFANQMRELIDKHTHSTTFFGKDTLYLDKEDCHDAMDGLMCKVLTQLGYGEGVDIFNDTPKWYA